MDVKVFLAVLFLSIFFSVSPIRAQWVQVADFAGAERDDLVAFTCNGRAFAGTGMAIGFQVTNDFYEYKPVSDQWVAIANLPGTSRQYAFCFSFETMAFVFAGINQAGNDLKDGYSFNPITDAWANVNAYPGNGSKGCAAATHLQKGYAGLGRNDAGLLHNDWWEFDSNNQSWTQKSSFPGAARNLVACFESNGAIYIAGGIGNNDVPLDDVWQYQPQTDIWTLLNINLPIPTGNAASCKVKLSGTVIAGYDGQSNCTNNALGFDAFNQIFVNLPGIPLQGFRKGARAFALDGNLYITCGISDDNTRLKSTWRYDLINEIVPNSTISESFSISPNPADNTLRVITLPPGKNIISAYSFFTIDGNEVVSGIISNNPLLEINTTQMTGGIYLLKLFHTRGIDCKKIIIQHP
jgi:N-acetylneuraminic acid mutarotase